MDYREDWDLSTIPLEVWRSENGRRIKLPAPRARVLLPCVQCGTLLSAVERRQPCPHCTARQPRPKSTKN